MTAEEQEENQLGGCCNSVPREGIISISTGEVGYIFVVEAKGFNELVTKYDGVMVGTEE